MYRSYRSYAPNAMRQAPASRRLPALQRALSQAVSLLGTL